MIGYGEAVCYGERNTGSGTWKSGFCIELLTSSLALGLNFSALVSSPEKFLSFFTTTPKLYEITSIITSIPDFREHESKPLLRGRTVYLSLCYFQKLKSLCLAVYKFAQIWRPLCEILWSRQAPTRKEWTGKKFSFLKPPVTLETQTYCRHGHFAYSTESNLMTDRHRE